MNRKSSLRGAFRCRCCGACCRIPDGIVRVSEPGIARIAAFLGKSEADFIAEDTLLAPDRRGLVLRSRPDGACVWLTAPKGSGTSVRRNFLSGAGINSSFAFEPNGMKAKEVEEVTKAIGIAVGSGYLFPTTFRSEVTSDLVGERGILMGALAGAMGRRTRRCARTAIRRPKRSTRPAKS